MYQQKTGSTAIALSEIETIYPQRLIGTGQANRSPALLLGFLVSCQQLRLFTALSTGQSSADLGHQPGWESHGQPTGGGEGS